jgi:protein transport protein SEC24
VPNEYFCNLDMNGRRLDFENRPELQFGTVDFAVTKEYCARPPRPASFVFAIDVSFQAIQSGMLWAATRAIKYLLYEAAKTLPAGTRVGIMTYNRSVHFYNLKSSLEQAQMLIVPDIDDVFVPLHEGFLVDPVESRHLFHFNY